MRYKLLVLISSALVFSQTSASNQCCVAQPLQGGVEVNVQLPQINYNLIGQQPEKIDTPQAQTPFKQDCLCFNHQNVSLQNIDGRWQVVDGSHWLLNFNGQKENAQLAVDIIKRYKLSNICFVGRGAFGVPVSNIMQYFLTDSGIPEGPFQGEDAIYFDPKNIRAEQANGTWKVIEGKDHWMLDFGTNKEKAQEAVQIIQYYGFTYMCFVGRPGAPMMYFRK